jgi:hypothetical protein
MEWRNGLKGNSDTICFMISIDTDAQFKENLQNTTATGKKLRRMARKPRWKVESFENGVVTVNLFSWDYYGNFIYDEMLDYNFVYRGHRCDNWRLESTLDRLLRKRHGFVRESYAAEQLERFKYAVRGRRGSHPPELKTENDWWALGQHNGLATPLLDWTVSPYVGAYFAFCNTKSDDTPKRVIYALAENVIAGKSAEILKVHKGIERAPIVEFFKPLSDENSRLVSQNGLLTRSPIGTDLETWIKQSFKGEKSLWILVKILIPSNNRENCLRELNIMNINHLTLFPNLYGSSTFCNMDASIEGY